MRGLPCCCVVCRPRGLVVRLLPSVSCVSRRTNCDVGRSPRELAEEFPGLKFDHLEDPWWHNGPLNERGLPQEPHEVFHGRVTHFGQWLAEHPNATVAVVGHGTFFRQLTGRGFANCEIVPWTPGA